MKNIKKILLALVVSTLIAGCQSPNGLFDYSKPASLNITPPPGSAAYKQGWNDGCRSGLASANTSFNLMLASYTYKIDGNLWGINPHYKAAWKDAYYYCTYHMFTGMMNTY